VYHRGRQAGEKQENECDQEEEGERCRRSKHHLDGMLGVEVVRRSIRSAMRESSLTLAMA